MKKLSNPALNSATKSVVWARQPASNCLVGLCGSGPNWIYAKAQTVDAQCAKQVLGGGSDKGRLHALLAVLTYAHCSQWSIGDQ